MNSPFRRTSMLLVAAALILPLAAAAQEEKAPAVNLDSELAKECYSAGMIIGKSISEPGIELDVEAFVAGFSAALKGEESAMDDEAMREAFGALQNKLRAAAQEKAQAMAVSSKAEGDAFLAENAQKEGVKTTDSGLQYRVIKDGDGPMPQSTDRVSVHYKGTFINGEEFDSSLEEPVTFGVTQVIPGWTEALMMMKVGSKWELAIPSDLAYGPQGRPSIPPNSVLLFEVELLGIAE